MTRPVLVATDARPGAAGALRWARLLARREGRPLHVLAVYEPVALYYGSAPLDAFRGPPDLLLERERQAQLHAAVLAQLREVGGETEDETVIVRLGAPAPTIVQYAVEAGTGRIVVGLGRHGRADRWLGTETALRAVHLAHVPVLAVAPGATRLPRRAVAGIDFSEFSLESARCAADLIGEGGELHLVHSTWLGAGIGGWQSEPEWFTTYQSGAEARLAALGEEIERDHAVRIHTSLASGEAAPELLRAAERVGADLIAAGSHGHGYFGRLILGSISTAVVRGAHCSVLVTPPRTVVEAALAAAAVQSATRTLTTVAR